MVNLDIYSVCISTINIYHAIDFIISTPPTSNDVISQTIIAAPPPKGELFVVTDNTLPTYCIPIYFQAHQSHHDAVNQVIHS